MESRAGINPFSPESAKSAREEKKRVEEYRKQIEKLIKTGGEDGSRGLREIIAGGDIPQKSRNEAIEALGSLRRPEDVAFLFEWPLQHRMEEARKYGQPEYITLTAIATIGGDEACRRLNGFLKEKVKVDGYEMHFGKFAVIITKAGCLTKEELADLARSASRNMWADRSLHSSALKYLAETGDAEAKTTLQKLDAISNTLWDVKRFPMELVPQTLHDPEVPWSDKVSLMDRVATIQQGSKEDLFDLYFDLAVLLVTERPDHRSAKSHLRDWAYKLISYSPYNKSVWSRTDAVTYLAEKRRRYRRELDEATFKHMDGIIADVLRWHNQRLEDEKRRKEYESKAVRPRSEPAFTSFGSRLHNAELFVFDERLRWYGLARLDLFLAGVAKELAVRSEETRGLQLRQRALRALSIEQAGKTQGPATAVLMPIPPDFVFEGMQPEWSPQVGDFSASFTTGQEKLVVMRLLRDGSASCWINVGPASTGGKERAFRFREAGLPAGSFVVLMLGPSTERIPVYLSSDGGTFSRAYRLLPDGSQEQFTIEESDIESIKKRFGEARRILERYEQETLAAAGGVLGVQKFRESLLLQHDVPSENP
jgi:hypothetical protein